MRQTGSGPIFSDSLPSRLMKPVLLLAALAVTVAGCDNAEPSDQPLPTVEQVQARFGPQAAGRGTVDDGENFGVSASHKTNVASGSAGVISTFRVNMLSESPPVALTILVEGLDGDDLRVGRAITAQFIYGRGDGGGGTGMLAITAVEGGRVEGVFAADLAPGGLYPDFRRIQGAFNATP